MAAVDTDLDLGDHVVQFYDRDADLTANVGPYLAAAARKDEIAIVIATDERRRRFADALRGQGVDPEAGLADGRLLEFDAATVLAQFMRAGHPDRALFGQVVGGLVRTAAKRGQPVRAYGEMVALLCGTGEVAAALELEHLWNDLAADVGFSLYCAYPADVIGHDDFESFDAVCAAHTAVVRGELTARIEQFAATLHSPRAARRFVIETLRTWGRPQLVIDGALVVSELATNAVVHAQSPYTVSIDQRPGAVRITVRDGSSVVPVPSGEVPRSFGGRGLTMIDRLSSRWDYEPTPDGKSVWAELIV